MLVSNGGKVSTGEGVTLAVAEGVASADSATLKLLLPSNETPSTPTT